MLIHRQTVLRQTWILIAALTLGLCAASIYFSTPAYAARAAASPAPTPEAAVLSFTIVRASDAAPTLANLFPRAHIRVDSRANALLVIALPSEIEQMRTIAQGIDVKSPLQHIIDVESVRTKHGEEITQRLNLAFPNDHFALGPNRTIVVSANQQDIAEIKTIISALDEPAPTPAPQSTYAPEEVVQITQRNPRDVGRAVAAAVHGVRIMVSGSSLLISGPQDGVAQAKTLATALDQPVRGMKYIQVYRLRYVDAESVAALLQRSFPGLQVQVDKDLNSLTVLADVTTQKRIADGIAQLDAGQNGSASSGGLPVAEPGTYAGQGGAEVYNMRAAVPGLQGATSTSATDLATTVTQALQQQAPDLHITVPPNSTQLVLTGSPYSVKLAKDLINHLDVAQPLVVLDTEVLEVDETVAKNLGLQFSSPVVSSTFNETTPSAPLTGGTAPPQPISLLPFTRTPLTLGVQLNLLVQHGEARILSDPRITTISGRTATIRAGDSFNILTTAGGGAGTIATTQVQTFQTGVQLDITPVVNAGNFITVTLHPVVSNLTGISNGLPQISTRDTTTTVGLQSEQTLIIGGLIEDTTNRTETRVPVLGDIPLVGHVFRNKIINHQRDELVITVTPHIVQPGELTYGPGPALPAIPTAQPLPTLAPSTVFPAPSARTASPAPTAMPAPASVQATGSSRLPAPVTVPTPSSAPSFATATPEPMPTAFSQVNVFTYGQAPQSNYAKPLDPVQIFYARVSPTVVKSGMLMTVSAITSTNVSSVTFGYGTFTTTIASTGPGQFQSTFSFSSAGVPFSAGSPFQMTLTAQRADGVSSKIAVPITITY